MTQIDLEPPHDHPVVIGRELKPPPTGAPLAIIYDPKVAYLAEELRQKTGPLLFLAVKGGERAKTIARYQKLLRALARAALPRDAEVWAVGGGTITDLSGFVAASYLRGVAWRAWPTTTLAMVDAAIGGKTGVNLPEGKNLVGAFHPPRGVYAELNTLATLPRRRFREGLVEAFKHGLISGDEALLRPWELFPNAPGLEAYLARAAAVKGRVVTSDFKESGERMKLNLGHTLAHALEAASGHRLSHGHAVAYGMLFAAVLGRLRGGEDLSEPILRLLKWTGAPPPPESDWDELWVFISRDKKNRSSGLTWVIPYAPGRLRLETPEPGELQAAFGEWRGMLSRRLS
ncbi:3-dehydroquinate synthase [Oceanithermus sp.]